MDQQERFSIVLECRASANRMSQLFLMACSRPLRPLARTPRGGPISCGVDTMMKNSRVKGRNRLALVIDLLSYSAGSLACRARALPLQDPISRLGFHERLLVRALQSTLPTNPNVVRGSDRLDLSGKPVALNISYCTGEQEQNKRSFNLSRGVVGARACGEISG